MASIPVMALTWGGSPRVSCGSNTATSGSNRFELMPALVVAPVVITATGVTSEPVPAVVGMRTKGNLSEVTWSTPYRSGSDCCPVAKTAMTLATSIELPPPRPITPSADAVLRAWSAASTTDSDGSAVTAENTLTSSQTRATPSRTGSTRPICTSPGSVTISGLAIPSC